MEQLHNNIIGNAHSSTIKQEESCFSLLACLGPSNTLNSQRNKDGSPSSQRRQ